ncbi:S-adenosyl-L-methionine-dependent methyltransferase [Aspergillus campestris IBT 28561]|uniref:S-adenosyl-L-methionine-dependent methyltransferase n=1 Tax=Aspergillus campestris (strain IBT 28561) TaxID=1392248 RepID=A0A2I1D7N2_ASPC2|nr:S-adenosyl-L-methionine-dependent methyltransferase [Aspergillus campestris IBT 28561]PKY05892.1 S-adenosyl-L-methionine-dependent methyltransferase [Aspergillus campestris IBT 28561]
MPRIPTSTILQAYRQHPLLPRLLQECRTLDSARNELRWLRERASTIASRSTRRSTVGWRTLLRSMCRARSKGVPLQYILGDQPFGDLEILCRRGVLIPRPETEAYTVHTADLIRSYLRSRERRGETKDESLRIVDICSGTGCISLLLHALLAPHLEKVSVLGIDLSTTALDLAHQNLQHNLRLGLLSSRAADEVSFHRGDVLDPNSSGIPSVKQVLLDQQDFSSHGTAQCDILISNPPYISMECFRNGTTARSVRHFEPQLALVPPTQHTPAMIGDGNPEDVFYHRIISLFFELQAKLLVLECGDRPQARRVVSAYTALANQLAPTDDMSVELWPKDELTADNDSLNMESEACAVIIQPKHGNP